MEFERDERISSSAEWNRVDDRLEANECVRAKAFLLKASTQTGLNLYDHLTRVLTKILDEKPSNAVDTFEDYSWNMKREKFKPEDDTIRAKMEKSAEIKLAEIQEKLFKKGDGMDIDVDPAEEETDSPLPNLLESSYYFEQAGIGLNREEVVRISLALNQLTETQPVSSARFWGKIFGIEQNYVVAEVEFREGEGEEEEDKETEYSGDDILREREEDDGDDEDEVKVPVNDTPRLDYKPPPVIPKEENRTGVNRKTYFVCSEPGRPWTKLPSVTPAQITVARQIRKFFTGRLDAQVSSYPPFQGTEANYLRAQIARISAGTQISPIGYYLFDEEQEEEEEGAVRENIVVNTEFEPIAVKDLVDSTLSNWVHHVQHILPQGRTSWWNPGVASDSGQQENEEEEEREEPEEAEPEVGPPLLTPLSEDAEVGNTSPWTAKLSSKMLPQYAVAVVSSCLWPGAYAFCSGRNFDNIYIGWGHKYLAANHNPPLPPPAQEEFPTGPEVTEMDDPSPEDEEVKEEEEDENADEAADEENELEGDEEEDDD